MEIIRSALTELLTSFALGVITLAGSYGIYYIHVGVSKVKAQTAQIKDARSRKLFEDAVTDVASLAALSVNAMEQTTAKALRDAVKTGMRSKNELLALGRQVFDEVKAAIAPETQKVITDNLGSFDDYLTKCIEDAVLKVKQNDPFLTLPSGLVVDGVELTAPDISTGNSE
ncbi:MAG: hypothetical protein HFG50_03955 [Lachnospiraceae bacterium]|nr:hypothetical protein [Lachnospiraceae bacterium]